MMVLDTHVLLWLRTGSDSLGLEARRLIEDAIRLGELAVSAISFWEVAVLQSNDRISFPEDVALWRAELLDQGLMEIPVDGDTAVRAIRLPGLPPDPADRIIVAAAQAGNRLVTADRRILEWHGQLSKVDARR